ncbi:hypothetical protein [Ruicaihuangia caeni]|uniref:hypothetical protein n=1 Tax=Ruicaihuangia caeni TaxID=3042517 RepID=UPI00338FF83B
MPVPAPRGARSRSAFDARLLIGIALIAASVGGAMLLGAASDDVRPALAASRTLTPGETVTAADLIERHVRLGDAESRYLVPAELPEGGVIVTRAVDAGELVPVSAIADRRSTRYGAVVIGVTGRLSGGILPGATVDVWAAQQAGGGDHFAPTVIVAAATVVSVEVDSSGMVSGRTTGVELLVPRERLALLLEAMADGDAISLVPVGLPLGR